MKYIILTLSFLFLFTTLAYSKPVRVLYNTDGTIRVIHPAPKSKRKGETEQEWLDRVYAEITESVDAKNLDYDDIDDTTLPSRVDRNYWKGNKQNGISIDTVKKAEKEAEEETKKNSLKQALGLSKPEMDDLIELINN